MSYTQEDAQIARLFAENQELRGERDRARATAVALEQQLAQIETEMRDLEQRYRADLDSCWTVGNDRALDAVHDCATSVETVTDVLTGDVFEANHLGGSHA